MGSANYTDIRTKGYERIRGIPTVELRMLDTFDTRGLYGIFSVISSTMANGEHTTKFVDPANQKAWNDAMESVSKEGWNAYLNKDYVKYLKKEMMKLW